MPRRLFRALLAVGPATVGVVSALLVVASLVTCSRLCHASPLSTYAGLRAAMERLP